METESQVTSRIYIVLEKLLISYIQRTRTTANHKFDSTPMFNQQYFWQLKTL